ncbi:hypothetical protein [Aeromicrobium sp. UC242_57]|uniref:hypothetical protein n=1 Tax=Aeromicrobium sp. UC242_57 TaxID=3374624 RepID=UPI0037971A15
MDQAWSLRLTTTPRSRTVEPVLNRLGLTDEIDTCTSASSAADAEGTGSSKAPRTVASSIITIVRRRLLTRTC